MPGGVVIWFPRIVGVLTAVYGLSAIVRPEVIARHGELDDPAIRRSGVALLSGIVGVRDVVSGVGIVVAPSGGILRVTFDAGDAALFGSLLPTRQARRKFAVLASGWGGVSALSMIWAGW